MFPSGTLHDFRYCLAADKVSLLQVIVLLVEAATFAGLVILFVQFANIMTTVRVKRQGHEYIVPGCMGHVCGWCGVM